MSPLTYLKRLFGPVEQPGEPEAHAPEGVSVYAIGDIHGRADLLDVLLGAVEQDREGEPASAIVFMGDYVDRGRQSREVTDLLLAYRDAVSPSANASHAAEVRFLRGNHDQSLLDFLEAPSTGPTWSDFGGRETLASYGVHIPETRADEAAWALTSEAFAEALPPDHLAFFQSLEYACEYGGYFFAHAGVRPGVPLGLQSQQDLMWIRQPFLEDTRRLEKVVVHGHTPTPEVYADRRRIGVDTGAYATGVLTALKLKGAGRSLLQAHRIRQSPPGVRTLPL